MPANKKKPKPKQKQTVSKRNVGGTMFVNQDNESLSHEGARVKIGDKGLAKLKAKKGQQAGKYLSVSEADISTSQVNAQPKRKLSQTEKNRVAKNESQRRISEVEEKREQRKSKKKAKK